MTHRQSVDVRSVDAHTIADITFVGTATTVIRLGSFTLLTDPNFLHRGERAYLGNGLWSRRRTEPSLQPQDLPPLDAVVLSHLHGDHFDRRARRGLDRLVPIVTTEQAAGRLRRYGFRTTGLPVWHTYEQHRGDEMLTIEALPAVHARGILGGLLPPVMGSMLVHQVGGRVARTSCAGSGRGSRYRCTTTTTRCSGHRCPTS